MYAPSAAGYGYSAVAAQVDNAAGSTVSKSRYERDIEEIKRWEDKIVRILTDGHSLRRELERELREIKMAERIGPEQGARFCIDMVVKLAKQEDGKGDHKDHRPFHTARLQYYDLKYAEMALIEKTVSDALNGLAVAASIVLEENR